MIVVEVRSGVRRQGGGHRERRGDIDNYSWSEEVSRVLESLLRKVQFVNVWGRKKSFAEPYHERHTVVRRTRARRTRTVLPAMIRDTSSVQW